MADINKRECQKKDGYHWVSGDDNRDGYCRKNPNR